MRIGVQLAQVGCLADPSALRRALVAAEQVGFDSVWVRDELVGPVLDPLGVLAYAAGVTEQVQLGASVIVAPWYRPRPLVRLLTAVDQLSNGRLVAGLGAGVSRPDPEALDRVLDAIDDAWGPDPRDHELEPRPAQRPRPCVLLAGESPADLERVARRADGWNPAGLDIADLRPRWVAIRDRAAALGREPDALRFVVRAGVTLTEAALDGDRRPYAGDLEQVAADLLATAAAGADEVILGVDGECKLDEALDVYARVAEAIDRRPPFSR